MSGDELAGVVFPASADGRRSTSALGRAVTADALRAADPAGALDAERDTSWRTGYVAHFRRLVEAGLPSRKAAVSVAASGLESLHRRMRVADADGGETGLDTLLSAPARRRVTTVTVPGTGQAADGLSLPYRGGQLRGDALARRLDAWVDDGVIEPSCADAVRTVAAHPEWLRLPGRTVVMLGAGAEVGPLAPLLGWGARVIAVDLPRPAIWERILDTARTQRGDAGGSRRRAPGPAPRGRGRERGHRAARRPGPEQRHPRRRRLARRLRRAAGAGQLRVRGRRGQRAPVRRGRRADRAPAGRPRRHRARVPRDADRRVRGPGRGRRAVRPRVRDPVIGGETRPLAAADAVRRAPAPPRLPARG